MFYDDNDPDISKREATRFPGDGEEYLHSDAMRLKFAAVTKFILL